MSHLVDGHGDVIGSGISTIRFRKFANEKWFTIFAETAAAAATKREFSASILLASIVSYAVFCCALFEYMNYGFDWNDLRRCLLTAKKIRHCARTRTFSEWVQSDGWEKMPMMPKTAQRKMVFHVVHNSSPVKKRSIDSNFDSVSITKCHAHSARRTRLFEFA